MPKSDSSYSLSEDEDNDAIINSSKGIRSENKNKRVKTGGISDSSDSSSDSKTDDEDDNRKMPSTPRNSDTAADHDDVDDDDRGGPSVARYRPSRRQPKRIQFPRKLRAMITDAEREGNDDIIRWLPDGKSFRVFRPKDFADNILPRYVNQSNYRSFQRQLYLYGFCRVHDGPSKNAYMHPKFKKDSDESDDMVPQQSKRRVPRRKGAASSSTDDQGDDGHDSSGGGTQQSSDRQAIPNRHDRVVPRFSTAAGATASNLPARQNRLPTAVTSNNDADIIRSQTLPPAVSVGSAQVVATASARLQPATTTAAVMMNETSNNNNNNNNNNNDLNILSLQLRAARGLGGALSANTSSILNQDANGILAQLRAGNLGSTANLLGGRSGGSAANAATAAAAALLRQQSMVNGGTSGVPAAVPVQITATMPGQQIILSQPHNQAASQLDQMLLAQTLNSVQPTFSLGLGVENLSSTSEMINRMALQRQNEELLQQHILSIHENNNRSIQQAIIQMQLQQEQAQLMLAINGGRGGGGNTIVGLQSSTSPASLQNSTSSSQSTSRILQLLIAQQQQRLNQSMTGHPNGL